MAIKRLFVLGLFFILIIAIFTTGLFSFQTSQEEAMVPALSESAVIDIPQEKGVFERAHLALDYSNMPVDENHSRSLKTYYDNRAYHGAPPSIPHEVNNQMSMGGKDCLKCHENGGWVEKFGAYTPVVPHPEKRNCRQCHVPATAKDLFMGTTFKGAAPPSIHNNALTGSPPIIPHAINLRENCLSCHAGPSAPKEIRVSHPERVNCRQCHAHNEQTTIDIGEFTRKTYDTTD